MVTRLRRELLLFILAAVLLAGLLDALISDAWDFVSIFSLSLALVVGLFMITARGRSAIGIRPDLARWIEEEAGTRGETVEALADRCVTAYRAGLTDRL